MSEAGESRLRIEAALYVVSTPIGNLGDISQRALEVLAAVDLVAAEDTRHSGRLLAHFGIDTPLRAYHDHSDTAAAGKLLDKVDDGGSVALISDAGTPLIADPGFRLVAAARQRGLKIIPVPGASALLAALAASGMPTDRFVFEGFLPARDGPRARKLESLARETGTMVFYEAPHRIEETLAAMREAFGEAREVVMARELTKQFETLIGDSLGNLGDRVAQDANQRRGEIVLVVAGAAGDPPEDAEQQLADTLAVLLAELPLKQAVGLAAKLTGASRNSVYEKALQMRKAGDNH